MIALANYRNECHNLMRERTNACRQLALALTCENSTPLTEPGLGVVGLAQIVYNTESPDMRQATTPFVSGSVSRTHIQSFLDVKGQNLTSDECTELFRLLRNLNLINDHASITNVVKAAEVSWKPSVALMHGKVAPTAHDKDFKFAKVETAEFTINDEYKLHMALNSDEETAWLRLETIDAANADENKSKHTIAGSEAFIVFNSNPKLRITLPEQLGAPSKTKTMKPPANTLDFLHRRFPLSRFIPKKEHTRQSEFIPYDDYVPHLGECIHDVAQLLFIHEMLSVIATALMYERHTSGAFDWDSTKKTLQTEVIQCTESLHDRTAYMAQKVSTLYAGVQDTNPCLKQLGRLYLEESKLKRDSLAASDFGHLLTVFFAYKVPSTYVVTDGDPLKKYEMTTGRQVADTAEFLKLHINKITMPEGGNGWQDHSRRWTTDYVIRVSRRCWYNLKGIMMPQEGGEEKYWQSKYNIQTIWPDLVFDNVADRQFDMSVALDATQEINLKLDIFHAQLYGTLSSTKPYVYVPPTTLLSTASAAEKVVARARGVKQTPTKPRPSSARSARVISWRKSTQTPDTRRPE